MLTTRTPSQSSSAIACCHAVSLLLRTLCTVLPSFAVWPLKTRPTSASCAVVRWWVPACVILPLMWLLRCFILTFEDAMYCAASICNLALKATPYFSFMRCCQMVSCAASCTQDFCAWLSPYFAQLLLQFLKCPASSLCCAPGLHCPAHMTTKLQMSVVCFAHLTTSFCCAAGANRADSAVYHDRARSRQLWHLLSWGAAMHPGLVGKPFLFLPKNCLELALHQSRLTNRQARCWSLTIHV